jgi:hypothetical protein
MSKANSSARQRRAGGAVLPGQDAKPVTPTSQMSSQQQGGLSLQQVIALIDKRLVNLETHVKTSSVQSIVSTPPITPETLLNSVRPDDLNRMADEFNSKFEMLASEVADLKDIILKLQSYTMDVNKTLMEERVRILSDLGGSNGLEFNVQELNGDSVGFSLSSGN